MTTRKDLFNFFLWWAVLSFSIWLGGTVYTMSVVVPMWSEALPQSVIELVNGTKFDKYINNFFGPPWMAIRNLLLLIALGLGWYSKRHRRYLLIAPICLLFGIVFTLTYVYPINASLFSKDLASRPAEEIQAMAHRWMIADKIRFVVMLVGYFFLLKAFRLPVSEQKPENIQTGVSITPQPL